jgi:hypothetical protein
MPKGFYKRVPLSERFQSRFRINEQTGCWDWTATKDSEGYGRITGDGGPMAHRVSYKLRRGPIPDGQHVLHRCDNPSCVNPDHLFLGTNADNIADKVAKGRQHGGGAHGRGRLTKADVIAIRASVGVPQHALGKQYGVCRALISYIRAGKLWAHVGNDT